MISTIIPADSSEPFYEVVPVYTIDEFDNIKTQKPIFTHKNGIKKSTNSIYVDKIFMSISLALEASHEKNIEIIKERNRKFRSRNESTVITQHELKSLQEKVNYYHELEKEINPGLDGKTIDYYIDLLNDKFRKLRNTSDDKGKKGRTLIYENKNHNQ